MWFGCALANDFGDWQREYWFAHKSVALIDKNYRAYLSFTGPDRVRYLNAILTNNIKDLAPSHGTVSLLLVLRLLRDDSRGPHPDARQIHHHG